MLPTFWCVPETSSPGVAAVVHDVHAIGTDDKADTGPASSSVDPLLIVAVTPVPTKGDPDATLNRKLPLVTSTILRSLKAARPVISSVPVPDLINVPESQIVPPNVVLVA